MSIPSPSPEEGLNKIIKQEVEFCEDGVIIEEENCDWY